MTVLDSRKGVGSAIKGDEALKPPGGPRALIGGIAKF
jgi:hypothetical protein